MPGVRFTVPPAELRFRASRASGPGGQHVNKAATRVEALWDVAASPSLTPAQRQALLDRLGGRIDKSGVLRVVSQRHRSQDRNRVAAVERLQELVRHALQPPKPRKKTRPPKSAAERRLQAKRARAEKKRQRERVGLDDT